MQALPVLIALSLVSNSVSWSGMKSTIFPYHVAQPSIFRYIVLQDDSGHRGDYWFPTLGSRTTNFNVTAQRGTKVKPETYYLHSLGGKSIRRTGSVRIGKQNLQLIRADYHGLVGHWVEEGVAFTVCGLVWHVTMSYDVRYVQLRPTMLRMMHSFRLDC